MFVLTAEHEEIFMLLSNGELTFFKIETDTRPKVVFAAPASVKIERVIANSIEEAQSIYTPELLKVVHDVSDGHGATLFKSHKLGWYLNGCIPLPTDLQLSIKSSLVEIPLNYWWCTQFKYKVKGQNVQHSY